MTRIRLPTYLTDNKANTNVHSSSNRHQYLNEPLLGYAFLILRQLWL